MPSVYRQSMGYKWYDGGDAQGLRQGGLPAFNTDNQGRITLSAGELFCRCPGDDGKTLCNNRNKFSSLGALKKHIRGAHQCDVAVSHPGGLTVRDDRLTYEYWRDIYKLAHGTDAVPETPRKAKAVWKDTDLLPIPYVEGEDGPTNVIDYDKMKENVGIEGYDKCTACRT
ncbi:hypothetical protein F4777DRAFT_580075 [Nemania sp. FL0916]|nr:hypothetical protein F4777DRAFT_580075 [Nemania sp. FL0916]